MAYEYHVMVVDDDLVVSDSLSAYLEDYGFTVTQKGDGEGALLSASGHFFSLAVVDLRLPGMTGEALVERFAQLSPETRFIIYTGLINYIPTAKLRAIGIGEEDIFFKPINDLGVLLRRVRDLIKK